jgi:hypothetical protein
LFVADFEDLISFSWEGDSEKNAVSEPEAAAEKISKIRIAINPAMRPAEEARSLVLKNNKTYAFNASGSGSATVSNN